MRPDGLCVITLLAALHSAAGTFHSLRRGRDQHVARRRAALADIFVRARGCRGCRRSRNSPQTRLRATFWPGVGYSVVHLRPVAFELLGDELGEAGERALAHLRAGDADHDRVVRA